MLMTALINDSASTEVRQNMVVGTPDGIAEQVRAKVLDAGVGGVTVNVPIYSPGIVAKLGQALKSVIS